MRAWGERHDEHGRRREPTRADAAPAVAPDATLPLAGHPDRTAASEASGRPPLRLYLGYIAILGLVLLLGIEVGCRLLFPKQDFEVSKSNDQLVYDPVVGWRGRRGFHASVDQYPYPEPVDVAINVDGFRDEDWDAKLARASATGAKRILLIGDSMVYGWGAQSGDRLSEQLAALYRLQGREVEVFNAGIPAYGPPQQRRLLPELLQRVAPDVVIVMFSENDYGDTALPYHQKYLFRVYRPFYNERAELVLNETIPKRPSLLMKDTFLGGLHLWQAVDLFFYLFQDWQYARYDIPNPRNAIYPLSAYDGFVWEEYLKERYPYVERTLLAIYSTMQQLTEEYGARFLITSATERVNYAIEPGLRARGMPFVPGPRAEKRYLRWTKVLRDSDHGNFIWAWIIGGEIYNALEGEALPLDFGQLPQLAQMPAALELADAGSTRFLSGDWGAREGGGRWLRTGGAVLLRNPDPKAPALALEVSARAGSARAIEIRNERDEAVCTLTLSEAPQTSICGLSGAEQPAIVFLYAVPHPSAPDQAQVAEEAASAWFGTFRVRPAV